MPGGYIPAMIGGGVVDEYLSESGIREKECVSNTTNSIFF
jgi:hypothetical protein